MIHADLQQQDGKPTGDKVVWSELCVRSEYDASVSAELQSYFQFIK